MALPSLTSALAVSTFYPRLVGDDLGLGLAGREVEFDGDEALAGGLLDVLQDTLVARVVGDDELKARRRRQCRAQPIDGELAAVIGEWMNDDDRVLASLHDLVQIADGALAHRARQRSVDPDRFATLEEESTHQIRRRHVFVACDRDEVAAELVGHRLDEPRLPAPGGALQQHRQSAACGGLEDLDLVVDRPVERRHHARFGDDRNTVGGQLNSRDRRERSSGAVHPPVGPAHRRC